MKKIFENAKVKIEILSTDEAARMVGIRTLESTYYWAEFFKELKDVGLSICKINTLRAHTSEDKEDD